MEPDADIRRENGFSSFFLPSTALAAGILSASIKRAREAPIPGRRKLAHTLLCISQAALNLRDQSTLDRVREDVSRQLWRYLGTLGHRSSHRREGIYVASEEIAQVMEERLGLSEAERELTSALTGEFEVWLREGYRGVFQAPWGRIVVVEGRDGVAVLGEQVESREEGERRAPAKVLTNYYGKLTLEDLIRKVSESKREG